MAQAMAERVCRSCKVSLREDHFRSRAASKKLKKKCRGCRKGKPYSRSADSSPAVKQGARRSHAGPPTPSSTAEDRQSNNEAVARLKTDVDEANSPTSPSWSTPDRDEASSPCPTPPGTTPSASASRAIDAAVRTTKVYRHAAPPGLSFSGPLDKTKSIQRQRRFLVPPGVTRVKHSDFPSLDAPLEPGMVAPIQGCLECTIKNIHCTYGAGVRLNGKTRDPAEGKCDYCLFTTRKCRGNGFVGYKSEQFGAHTELVKLLNRLEAQVETCSRAGEEDRSRAPNRKTLVGNIDSVREKLAALSTSLKQGRANRSGAGSAPTSAIVID